MSRILLLFAKSIDKVNALAFGLCSLLTILLVFLTTEQVIARYFFNASSVGLQELEWHLFGCIILLSMAHALKTNEHVRVDVLYTKASARTQKCIDCLGILLFLIPVSAVLVYYGYNYTIAALAFPNPFPADHWSAGFFGKESALYSITSPIEAFLRQWIILGEVSPDPGGLEARWLIKGAIPFGFMLLFFQGIATLLHTIITFKEEDR
jgi:TRAP-type mannitol/chloroaromatic compound transport system permease small subunit